MIKRSLAEWDAAVVLLGLFIFLLPYLQLGIPVGPYAITPSDAVLICLTLLTGMRAWRRKQWPCFGRAYRVPWIALAVLLIALLPGALKNRQPLVFVQEMLPYLHALCVIFCFTSVLAPDDRRVGFLIGCYQASFVISVIPALFWFTPLFMEPSLRMFGNDAQKYQFLCISPNQYSLYALTAVFLLLLGRTKNLCLRLSVIALAAMVILMSGSRGGAVLLAFVFCYVLVDALILSMRKQLSPADSLLAVIVLVLFFGVLVPRIQYRFWNTDRALSGIAMVAQGQFGDEFRQIQFDLAKKEFLRRPLAGIGLGAYRHIASDRYEVHNSFLSLLVENGIVGFAGLLFFLGALAYLALRCGRVRMRHEILVVLLCVCGYMLAHHVLRERWLWVLFAVIIIRSACEKERQRQCAA